MKNKREKGPPQHPSAPVQPLDDPDFINAQKALNRAAEKALERARRANLEPVVAAPDGEVKPRNYDSREKG